jgi:glycosyltransferase involved in cell wall biosynthesis
MIRCLFETSLLGLAVAAPRHRTGLFRVTAEVARALASNGQCQMIFHALNRQHDSRRYFAESLASPTARFGATPLQLGLSKHFAAIEDYVAATVQLRSAPRRALRRALTIYRASGEKLVSSLDRRLLADADVYHSPFFPVPPWVRLAANRVPRFTTIYDLIAIRNPELFQPAIAAIVRDIISSLTHDDWALCISENTRQDLLEETQGRLDPARVLVTPLAAGPAFHPEERPDVLQAVAAKYRLPTGQPYLLSLCTVEPRKNLDRVIRSFADVVRSHHELRDLHLVLVGNAGWKNEAVFQALEECRDVQEQIVFTGFVPDEELAAIYSQATAFIYLSRYEGFGLPPLEAMQCGLPVICSNRSSLPEVVGSSGVLVDPDDADAVSASIVSVCTDAHLREAMRSNGLARAAQFSWEQCAEQTIAGYRAALAER